jgi:hypothetical protein
MQCVALTAKSEQCRGAAQNGYDRCSFHLGLPVGGAHAEAKLTPELRDRLVSLLRAGNYIEVAVRACKISKQTFYVWMRRGASDEIVDAPYRELRELCETARAEGEARNVAHIATAARESWQAAAWLLERQHPDRWGRVSVRLREELNEEAREPAAAADDDPFAEVDQLAERRAQRG